MILSSKDLHDQILKVLNVDNDNIATVEITLYSSNGEELDIGMMTIDHVSIEQNFFDHTVDNIEIIVNTPIEDVLKIYAAQTGLKATIRLTHTSLDKLDQPYDNITIIDTVVFIKNMQDLSTQFNLEELLKLESDETRPYYQAATLISLEMQLLDINAYNMRKNIVNGIFSDCSIDQVIRYASVIYGASRLDMDPVDNKLKYRNLIIPPKYSRFNTMVNYLQDRYGIYLHDVGYFYTRGVLYVKPLYELSNTGADQLVILRPSSRAYGGSRNCHMKEDDKLTIVVTGEYTQQPLHGASTENEGNSYAFLKADTLIDGTVDINGSDISIKDTSLVCDLTRGLSVVPEASIPRYIDPMINLFKLTSKANASTCDLVSMEWHMSEPYSIEPFKKFVVYRDKEGKVAMSYGRVIAVRYIFDRKGLAKEDPRGKWSAVITAIVTPIVEEA